MGLIALLGTSGCVIKEREYRGGVYDEHHHFYGHYRYPYDHDRDWDHHY
jgi:hypothetical protein